MGTALPYLIAAVVAGLFFPGDPAFAETSQKPDAENAGLLSQVLGHMEQAGKNLVDLKANFQQTKVFTLFEDKTESGGKLTYKRPGKILWEFEEPNPSKLVINKEIAWLYLPKIKQVQKVNLKDKAQTESLLIGFGTSAAEIQDSYEVNLVGADKVDQKEAYILELIPKKELSSYFSKILLWIDQEKWIPTKTELVESSGDTTTIEFTAIQLNTHIPDDLFNFKIPNGAEVIDYSK